MSTVRTQFVSHTRQLIRLEAILVRRSPYEMNCHFAFSRLPTPRLRAQKWAVTKITSNRLQIDIHSILATEQHELLLSNLHGWIHVMAVFRAAAGGGATVVVFGLGTLLVTNVIINVVKGVVTLRQVVSAVIDNFHLLQMGMSFNDVILLALHLSFWLDRPVDEPPMASCNMMISRNEIEDRSSAQCITKSRFTLRLF